MGFWIYMLLMNLLITFTLIGFGKYFMKKAPKEINGVFGYRTSMSMKNKDTWEFAHKYCGKIWYLCGLISLPITVIPMLLVVEKNVDVVGTVGANYHGSTACFSNWFYFFQAEIALRKNFDKNGERRSHGIDQVKRME